MKRILWIIFALFIGFTFPLAGEETFEKTIAGETVEFVVPEDYIVAIQYYKAVMDAYVESENANSEKDEIILTYMNTINNLKIQIDDLKLQIQEYERKTDEYIELSKKPKVYFGVGGSFIITIYGQKQFTVYPQGFLNISNWDFGFSIPVSFSTSGNLSNQPAIWSIGLGLSALRRLSF